MSASGVSEENVGGDDRVTCVAAVTSCYSVNCTRLHDDGAVRRDVTYTQPLTPEIISHPALRALRERCARHAMPAKARQNRQPSQKNPFGEGNG